MFLFWYLGVLHGWMVKVEPIFDKDQRDGIEPRWKRWRFPYSRRAVMSAA
jgi:hypothetical protein